MLLQVVLEMVLVVVLVTTSLQLASGSPPAAIRYRKTTRGEVSRSFVYEHDVDIHSKKGGKEGIVNSPIGLCEGYRVQDAVHSFVNNNTLVPHNDAEKFYPIMLQIMCEQILLIPELRDYLCDDGSFGEVIGAVLWSDDAFQENGIHRFLIYAGYDIDTTTNCICSSEGIDCSDESVLNDIRNKVAFEIELNDNNKREKSQKDQKLLLQTEGATERDLSIPTPDRVYYNHTVYRDRSKRDVTISLGYNCESAVRSKDFGFRQSKAEGYRTCPFDILLTNYEGLVLCLAEDFAHLTDTQYLEVVNVPVSDPLYDTNEDKIIYNTRYNFVFLHESPIKYQWQKDNWPGGINHFILHDFRMLKERYDRRVANFRSYLNGNYNVLFVLLTPERGYASGLPRLNRVLRTMYPAVRYRFSKFNHRDDNEQFLVHHNVWMHTNESDIVY